MRFHRIVLAVGMAVLLSGQGCSLINKMNFTQGGSGKPDSLSTNLTENKQIEYRYKYIEAIRLKLLGQTSEALSLLDQCTEIRPYAPDPYYQMSLIARKIDEVQEAVKYGKKAVEYGADNRWYRLHLANLYLQNNRMDSARIQYEYLVEQIDQKELDLLYRLGQLYQKTEKYQKALDYYNQIEQRVGSNEKIAEHKRSLYTRMGEKEKAYQEVRKLIEQDPDNVQYYGMLAEMYATFDEYEKAEAMYDKVFELDSNNMQGQLSLVKYYLKQDQMENALEHYVQQVIPNESINFRNKMLLFINFLRKDEQINRFIPSYEKALAKLDQHYPDKNEVQALYADFYWETKQLKKAAKPLENLVKSSDSQSIYWEQLLTIYSYLNDFDKMYSYGKKAVQKYETRPRLYLFTGMGAMRKHELNEALKYFEKGLEHIEDDRNVKIQLLIQLGESHYQLKDYGKSDHYFNKVLEIDPDNKMVLNNYSYYLSLREEKLNKALELSQKVINDHPKNPIYLDTYAWILYKKGKYEKARRYIEKAIRHGGDDDSDIVEHYGDILYKTGEEEKAFEFWQKSKQLGNQSDVLDFKLKNRTLPQKSNEN